jgi:hypothetical protein
MRPWTRSAFDRTPRCSTARQPERRAPHDRRRDRGHDRRRAARFGEVRRSRSIRTGTSSSGANAATGQLILVDRATGAGTAVGPIGFLRVEDLSFDPIANKLYGVDAASGQLLSIDTTTGVGTAIGLTRFTILGLSEGL